MKLDKIGGHSRYSISAPPLARSAQLEQFLRASMAQIYAYGACYDLADGTVYAEGEMQKILRGPRADPADISTDIMHLARGGTWIYHVSARPNSIALALICADLFDSVEWRPGVYFIGRGYHGMPDALYYVLMTSEGMLLPPEALRAAPMGLFSAPFPSAERWLQDHPDATHHCFSPLPS